MLLLDYTVRWGEWSDTCQYSKNGKLGNDMKAVAFIEKETVETNTAEEIAVTGTVVDEQRRPKAE